MKLLAPLALALLAVPLRAATPEPPPAGDALVETFLSIFPRTAGLDPSQIRPDPVKLDRLRRLNPGRKARVKAVMDEHRACMAPLTVEHTRQLVRSAARSLGDARLQRLIDFFQKEDAAAVTALTMRLKGGSPSPGDAAEYARLDAAYPWSDYNRAINRAIAELREDKTFRASFDHCASVLKAAVARAGLKQD